MNSTKRCAQRIKHTAVALTFGYNACFFKRPEVNQVREVWIRTCTKDNVEAVNSYFIFESAFWYLWFLS